jgi:glyoxylase-like metal-dependent hydrolase (beta-lactamase superfamily II)
LDLVNRLDNIYLIDTNMLGFDHYMSVYLVASKELALIDTGLPTQLEQVRAGIKAHGFSISDISYIFVTHCEHPDHGGNVGPLLRESPKAKVYIHPLGDEYLTHPEIEEARRVGTVEAGKKEPVPPSRIQHLNDDDVFDLGNGEKLRIIFAPGHQPSGIVIFEEKNKGLFINDLVGNYFPDADALYPLNPVRSDNKQSIESLSKLVGLPVAYLYLCHYGISDKPKQIMTRAINNMQKLLDIGAKYMREGKPELIADKVYQTFLPELEKIRSVRGEAEYAYASQKLGPHQAKLFAKYCQEKLQF